jgi:exonuclease SbcC
MKPINLYMRNFKSYGENAPELDFDNFDVILLTGDNGNGKSSIAEAIAWALWGQCKGVTEKIGQDDLVRIGSSDMEVSFTFEEDGLVYKVIRKRDKKRGQSSLDLLIQDGKNRFVPAGGNTKPETQAKIKKIIKLDYDTYICTSYLSQGKADIFATKKPNERKDILSEILNLSIYEKMKDKASEKRRIAENNAEVLDREINYLLNMISQNNDVEARLNDVIKDSNEIEKEKQIVSGKLDDLNKALQEMEFCKRKEKDYRENLLKTKQEKTELEKNLTAVSDRIKSYEQLLKDETSIVQRYKKLQNLREENDILMVKSRQVFDLDKKRMKVEQEIKTKEISIKNEIRLIEKETEVYRVRLDKRDELLRKQAVLSEELKKLNETGQLLSSLEEKVKDETGKLSIQSARLKVSIEKHSENIEKIERLKKADSICPVCSSLLDDVHKEELIKEAEMFGAGIEKEAADIRIEVKAAEERIRTQNRKINEYKSMLKERSLVEGQLGAVSDQIKDAEASKQKIDELRLKIKQFQTSLESRNYCLNEIRELNRLNALVTEIGYTPESHKKIESELKTLTSAQERWIDLQKARSASTADDENRKHISEMINHKNSVLKNIDAQLIELSNKTKDMPVVKDQINNLQSDKSQIDKKVKDLEAKRGMLIERFNAVKRAQNEILAKQNKLEHIRKMVTIYKILTEIYGKSGIQAAIIENAIPELEVKTNEILGRITDGRLFVELLTQRDKKSGGTIETLDIKISDESGTRKYETYSGGEEFRINFAIRIALSKVLAHRAGASLRMLVLDEGFGVLDEQGREKLVEAINSIKDEFDNILVITHIQDLKEAFPLRLEVTKTVNGSTFKMTG